ncbi:MAG: Rab family GTPase [Candidatus Hermodarchaeota archaeon]
MIFHILLTYTNSEIVNKMTKLKVLKTIIAGEGGVGKTTMLHRYIKGKFIENMQMTIGVEFFLKELKVEGEKVLMQIWDFGGQERFRFLLENYARGAKGALLLFDLTRPITLENLEQWVNICRVEDQDLPILFIGSKSDLTGSINISEDFLSQLQEENNFFNYLKISSKTGANVELAFKLLAKEILSHIRRY